MHSASPTARIVRACVRACMRTAYVLNVFRVPDCTVSDSCNHGCSFCAPCVRVRVIIARANCAPCRVCALRRRSSRVSRLLPTAALNRYELLDHMLSKRLTSNDSCRTVRAVRLAGERNGQTKALRTNQGVTNKQRRYERTA